MDFDRAASKLKKEQEKRRAEAQRKLERERKAQEEARRQQALIAEAVQQRKREQAEREEADRLAAEAERLLTAGIAYSQELLALDAEGEGDKVILPPSALEALTKQDALAQGPMLFRITLVGASRREEDGSSGGKPQQGEAAVVAKTTHAGVLEFSAEEGTVGLPWKVQRSLGRTGEDAPPLGYVKIKYVRLEKGTYAKIQPRTGGLSQVPELKAMLEMNLHNHATLSQGDVLQVWHRGRPFDLRVVELQPEAAVTVIDTDIEVDLDVPEEQQRQEQQQAASAPSAPSAAAGTVVAGGGGGGARLGGGGGGGGKTLGGSISSSGGSGGIAGATTATPTAGGETSAPAAAGAGAARDEAAVAALLAKLPAEPAADAPEAMGILVRKPDGTVASRRFLRSAAFQAVFDFVDASNGGGGGGSYRLVTRFPRRVFTAEGTAGQSLAEAGLAGKQETFMFEAC